MPVAARQILILCLVAAFVAQTWLVYSDPIGREAALSPLAMEGQALWRANNCQSCHQIYGFGGFLGPDLTNSIDELSAEGLESVLTLGAGQMPAFELGPEQRTALVAYLRALNATGVSQPRLGAAITPAELLHTLVGEYALDAALSPPAARGWSIVEPQGCIVCHLPNLQSLHLATCLTRMAASVEPERLFEVLHDGLPGEAMPRLELSPADCSAVLAFLQWLGDHGPELRARFESLPVGSELDLSRVPWFEFR